MLCRSPSQPQPKSKLPVGPVVLGFFLFVVFGSGECHRTHTSIASARLQQCGREKKSNEVFLLSLLRDAAVLQIIRATES
jgi:hypothetical protein